MGSRSSVDVLRWVSHVLLIFIFTTMLLMMYASRLQHLDDELNAVERTKEKARELIRVQRLKELQRTIFINPKRPPDQTYNINVTLSERIPLERDIPDTRPTQCQRKVYDISSLPTITVIIPFYNEALSMLLRTVHSILKRTPPELLSQIILVNENSPNEDLKEPLEKYVALLPRKVILVRPRKREGLIRARMIGASMATGDVLMFQDAHTEANVQWAEPLLEEIVKNPKTVIQPNVDQVEANTIQYIGGRPIVPRGGFSWYLRSASSKIPEQLQTIHSFIHSFIHSSYFYS